MLARVICSPYLAFAIVLAHSGRASLLNLNNNRGRTGNSNTFVGDIVDVPAILRNLPEGSIESLTQLLTPLIVNRINRPSPLELFAQLARSGIFGGNNNDDNNDNNGNSGNPFTSLLARIKNAKARKNAMPLNPSNHRGTTGNSNTFVRDIVDVPAILRNLPEGSIESLTQLLTPLIVNRINRPSPLELFAQLASSGIFGGNNNNGNTRKPLPPIPARQRNPQARSPVRVLNHKNMLGNTRKPNTFVDNIVDVPTILRSFPDGSFEPLTRLLEPVVSSHANRPRQFELVAQLPRTAILRGNNNNNNGNTRQLSHPRHVDLRVQSRSFRPLQSTQPFAFSEIGSHGPFRLSPNTFGSSLTI